MIATALEMVMWGASPLALIGVYTYAYRRGLRQGKTIGAYTALRILRGGHR